MTGLTTEELDHYKEYRRLHTEALALYREWDIKPCTDAKKAPHYKRAGKIMERATAHLRKYIDAGGMVG